MNTADEIHEAIKRRQEVGLAKYGKTMERRDLSAVDWAEHAYQEALDGVQYALRCNIETRMLHMAATMMHHALKSIMMERDIIAVMSHIDEEMARHAMAAFEALTVRDSQVGDSKGGTVE